MKAFSDILVYVDARIENATVLERAAQLAENNQAALKIVDVIAKFHWPAKLALPDYHHLEELLAEERRHQLQTLAGALTQHDILIGTKVLVGKSSVEIIREVQRHHHDLVVCRPKGANSKQKGRLGTTCQRLLRHCPCPVWVCPDDARSRLGKALVAVDPVAYDDAHAELNSALLNMAKALQATEPCELMIAHAWSFFGEQVLRSRLTPRQIEELRASTRSGAENSLRQLVSQHGLTWDSDRIIIVEGDPSVSIPEIVERHNVDLLLIGTVARSGVAGIVVGNTAESVFNRVSCSILALKPTTFVSPIRINDEHRPSVTVI
jgi:nucleotide-binding universal stress UspA family protein